MTNADASLKGKILGRKQLEQFGTLFTPDTILRWHRQLIARKWDYSDRREKKPGRPRVRQVIVELTNCEDGFLNGKRYLIMDRDRKFCESFRSFLRNEEIKSVRLPPRAPNMNAHLERFFGSLKFECLNRLILFGETATRNAVRQTLEHYHADRCHQGLDNTLIMPMEHPPDTGQKIETTERLGGLLRSYRRAA